MRYYCIIAPNHMIATHRLGELMVSERNIMTHILIHVTRQATIHTTKET